ncbi:hypothetical protein [Pedobacter sp. Leaf194]|nr:hypothetical protein [Pedobacter sp. Leaf194]
MEKAFHHVAVEKQAKGEVVFLVGGKTHSILQVILKKKSTSFNLKA